MATKGVRKFKFERQMGRAVMNPMVAALERIGVRPSLVVELETTGAKSGQPRRVPLAGRADDNGVWVISQHGRRAGWAYNIAADPKVRVRVNSSGDYKWRTGTATFEPLDDIRARARSFGGGGKLRQSATALTMRAMESDPISVRITYDSATVDIEQIGPA
jgi:deazaflavin-dependent oxidoreductase (nitroreductase family)